MGTLACLAALSLAVGCDALGNPPRRSGMTSPTVWRESGVRVLTQSRSMPSEVASEQLSSLPPDAVYHADPIPPAGGVVTLVMVEVRSSRALGRTLRFVTDLRVSQRRTITRRWSAPNRGEVYHAIFALEKAPVHVVTRLR